MRPGRGGIRIEGQIKKRKLVYVNSIFKISGRNHDHTAKSPVASAGTVTTMWGSSIRRSEKPEIPQRPS